MADEFNISDRGNAGVRVFHNANQSIANVTFINLAFNTLIFDTDNLYDSGVNTRLTIRTPGRYLVGFDLAWDTTSNTGQANAKIRLNGTATDIGFGNWYNPGVGGINGVNHCSTLYRFAAGDFIEVRVFQATGAALNIISLADQFPVFYAQRLDA